MKIFGRNDLAQVASLRRRQFAALAAAAVVRAHGCARPSPLEAGKTDHDLQSLRRRRRHRRPYPAAGRDRRPRCSASRSSSTCGRRGRHAGAGHAAQRQAGRPAARLHEHQQPALSALPADQLGSAEGLHLYLRPVGLHDGHRRARRCAVEDARGHDRLGQEGAGEGQLRHLGHRRHRPAHDDRGRAGRRARNSPTFPTRAARNGCRR